MSWTQFFWKNAKLQDVINHVTSSNVGDTHRTLKSSLMKDGELCLLWLLSQRISTGEKNIHLVSIEKNEDWWYLIESENVGIRFYGCPIEFIKEATPSNNEEVIQWRQECLRWHEKRKAIRQIHLGQIITFFYREYDDSSKSIVDLSKKFLVFSRRENRWFGITTDGEVQEMTDRILLNSDVAERNTNLSLF